jgi:hypothetical protein
MTRQGQGCVWPVIPFKVGTGGRSQSVNGGQAWGVYRPVNAQQKPSPTGKNILTAARALQYIKPAPIGDSV